MVTAHNSLWSLQSCETEFPVLVQMTAGSNTIIYSAQIIWLDAQRCLVAAGTAFGEITLWSSKWHVGCVSSDCESQIHYTFSAHQGSVFGLQISPEVHIPGHDGTRRLLASCSDDRTVRLWDITTLESNGPSLAQLHHHTGFALQSRVEEHAPELLAKTMGHASRIWHVRFVLGRSIERPQTVVSVVSFGEDANAITWELQPAVGKSEPVSLRHQSSRCDHAGKNIWSVAMMGQERLVTGGADGAIAISPTRPIQNEVCDLFEPALKSLVPGDEIRSYSLLSSDLLVMATDEGYCVMHKHPSECHVAGPFEDLKHFSIIASVEGAVFVSGNDGTIRGSWNGEDPFPVVTTGRKPAGLFPCRMSEHVLLLVTSVGSTSGRLFHVSGHCEKDELLHASP